VKIALRFVLVFAPTIAAAQDLSVDSTPPGRLVDIGGGQRLHVECTGRGAPTVILEAGTGDLAVIWSLVQPEVALFTRVCSYDRGGYGWSDPGRQPRTFAQLSLELRTALLRLDERGPYVLAGQSYGGLVVRGFTRAYAKDVAGIVLVDAVHEDGRVVYGGQPHQIRAGARGRSFPEPKVALDTELRMRAAAAARRPVEALEAPLDRMPPAAQRRWRWAMQNPLLGLTQGTEQDWSSEELQRMHDERLQNRATLGDLPLIVLSRTRAIYASGMSISADSLEQERRNLQNDLAALSRESEHRTARDAGHNLHLEDPPFVVQAIRDLVTRVRQVSR